MPHLPASDALSHIRVIDLTRVRSGPTAVRQLADWGADVIKVEAPDSVEPDGALGASRHTSDFQNLHRNKRSITLNLKKSEALEILRKLNGKTHFLISSVCISKNGSMIWHYTDKAELKMKTMTEDELKIYLSKIEDEQLLSLIHI